MPESVNRSSAVGMRSSYGVVPGREPGAGYAPRVNVRVRLFAALRERAGAGSVEVELPEDAVVGDVWPALGLGDEPAGLLYALNRGYSEKTAPLSPGDEVAVIPPVSGGDFALSEEPLSIETVAAKVKAEEAGAAATVRRAPRGRP